jgi:hypothetical protein
MNRRSYEVKKHLLHIATTLSLCLMLGAAAAAQMTRQMTVTVPFDFYVGKTALPAGTYSVYATSTHTGAGFLLRGADGHAKVVFNTQQVQSGESSSIARLEFRRYSDKYFLARVWAGGSDIGRELEQSRLERETAQSATRNLAHKDVKTEFISVTTQ